MSIFPCIISRKEHRKEALLSKVCKTIHEFYKKQGDLTKENIGQNEKRTKDDLSGYKLYQFLFTMGFTECIRQYGSIRRGDFHERDRGRCYGIRNHGILIHRNHMLYDSYHPVCASVDEKHKENHTLSVYTAADHCDHSDVFCEHPGGECRRTIHQRLFQRADQCT